MIRKLLAAARDALRVLLGRPPLRKARAPAAARVADTEPVRSHAVIYARDGSKRELL